MALKSKTTLPIILAMIILIVALVYVLFIRPNFHLVNGGVIYMDATFVGRLNQSDNETILSMGDALYVSTDEGLTKYALNGDSIWNKSFHVNDKLFMEADPYIAIVDLTGKNAYIFDENGEVGSVQTDYEIVGGYLNARGFLSLILDNDQENFINVYTNEGALVVERRTIFKKDGYPIELAMTSDGTKMMTSHLKVSDHIINSSVTFLDFSQQGEEYEDRVVGTQSMNDTMASSLNYIGDNHGVIVGDNQIDFFAFNPVPKRLNSIEVEASILDVAFTKDWLIVSYGEAKVPSGEAFANKVIVYDENGLVVSENSYDSPVTGLSAEDETYFVILSSDIVCYNAGGSLWTTTTYKPVEAIEILDKNQYLLIFDYNYEVVEIRDI